MPLIGLKHMMDRRNKMNDSYLDGEIRQDGVGKFYLGWSMDKVIENIDFEYEVRDYGNTVWLKSENITFLFWKDILKLQSIFVEGNYRGKFMGELGIGVAIEQIKTIEYAAVEDDNACPYELPEYPGIKIYIDFKRGPKDSEIVGYISLYWCGQRIGDETVEDDNWGSIISFGL